MAAALAACPSYALDTGGNTAPLAEQKSSHPSQGEILFRSIGTIPSDLKNIFYYPVEHTDELKKFALVVGTLVLLDKPVTKFYQNHVETPLSGFRLPSSPLKETAINDGANGWLLLGVGGSYLGGALFGDVKSQQAGLMSVKAMAYSVIFSQLLLKSITGRKRPISWATNGKPDGTYTNNPYDFGHFHSPNLGSAQYATSMPSFHFTMYFAVAKVYQRTYDNYLVPYSLATIALASNIRGHKHWVSDMVAGALIGTAIGEVVFNDDSADASDVKITPYVDKSGAGLQLLAKF
jgi:membrane-associated phospholipid phosphatase